MAHHVLSFGLTLSLASAALAYEPLIDQRFQYPNQIPYKVDTDPTGRGPQSGYTLCNSTTEGPNSECQLGMVNNIADFCVFGPPTPNTSIADAEASTIAWCSVPGHGARTMPQGTLTGVQVLRAPAYMLIAGTFNQANIDMPGNDYGGELDPRGADLRGNPLGGLVYTNGLPSSHGNNNTFTQVIDWMNFVGSDVFCMKICDPTVTNSFQYCNNRFDRTGCNFVSPATYSAGVFESCESDNQDPVGVYTSNGVVMTYSQPPDGVVINTLPSIRTPASSSCTTYNSADLYAAANTVTPSVSPTGTGASSSKPTGSSSGSGGKVVTTTTPAGTNKPSGATTSSPSGTHTGAAGRRVNVPSLQAAGAGMGPAIAIAGSVLGGLAAILAGL